VRFTFVEESTIHCEAEQDGTPRRAIGGQAVPWNVVGKVSSGQLVKFLPGSVSLAGEAVIRDHDRTRPIGVVASEINGDTGLHISTKVSATAHGDEALVLASDGVLKHWSVGVNPTKFAFEDSPAGPVLVVEEAEADEVSLLIRGAFGADAAVSSVAASEPTQEAPVPDPIEATPVASVVPIHAAPSRKSTPPLTLNRLASIIAASEPGSIGMAVQKAMIEAATSTTGALENILTTDVPEVVQRTYLTEITGLLTMGRPMVEAISRGALPPAGMQIQWPTWETLPNVDIQATQKSNIATGPVAFGTGSADVITWAGGNDISIQLAQRSNPSFMEEYFRACAEVMARKQNAYVSGLLLADAVPVTAGADFTATLQALLGALDPTALPDGGLFLALAWDQWVDLVGVKDKDKPAFWSGSVSFGSADPSVSASGLNVFVDRSLAAGTMLLGSRAAAMWHEDPKVEIRVVDVSLLGLDAGLYQFGAVREVADWTKTMAKVETGGALMSAEPTKSARKG